jgi:hypothetical protein
MPDSSFIQYVGDPDFHDGRVLTINRQAESLTVRVQGGSGRVFVVTFGNVAGARAIRADGMMLYALGEFAARPPFRRFVFANWDDESDSVLEVEAETIEVHPE